jgi:hypothetical protein
VIAFGIGAIAWLNGSSPADAKQDPKPAEPSVQFGDTTKERVMQTTLEDGRLLVRTGMRPLPKPPLDPIDKKTPYPYVSGGYARPRSETSDQVNLRFEVYAPDAETLSLADKSCHYLLRLWDMLSEHLKMDHPYATQRLVKVFLNKSGKPGGEQKILSVPDTDGVETKANCVFVYGVGNLTDPLETCRELAHEYGHAVLPAIGGFTDTEFWANGDIGERLFLRWLLPAIEAKEIAANEVFEVPIAALRDWVARNVDALSDNVLKNGFEPSVLNGTNRATRDSMLGFVMAIESEFGGAILGRGMALSNGTKPIDLYNGVTQAIREKETLAVSISGSDPVWVYLPGGDWKVTGAKIVRQGQAGWFALVATPGAKVTIKHPLP